MAFVIVTMPAKADKYLIQNIIIASDPHLMAPELAEKGSKAFSNAIETDMRMIAESNEIMKAWVDKVIAAHPNLVIITGDLTKDGELASHQRMAYYLKQINNAGIKTLVIPGNHDISNPNAKRYVGNDTQPVPTIDRETFAQIYADSGYGNGTVRDTASLSYLAYPINGIAILGIDSNLDEQNMLTARGDSVDSYHNAGMVKPETLKWVGEQALKARNDGNKVIAIMHHHAVEHFDSESRFLPNYILQNAEELRQTLFNADVHVIFTGHLHINDIARAFDSHDNDSITEIATGSLITYPFAYRKINIARNTMSIETPRITAIKSVRNLKDEGKKRLIKAAPAMINGVFDRAWNKVNEKMGQLAGFLGSMNDEKVDFQMPGKPQALINTVNENFGDLAAQTIITVAEGNEKKADANRIIKESKKRIAKVISDLMPGANKMFGSFFIEEVFARIEPFMRSLLEDKNNINTPNQRVVNDLKVKIKL